VAGAYRATPICSLEIETFTPPIDLYLDSQLAAFQRRLRIQRLAKSSKTPATGFGLESRAGEDARLLERLP
jgi:hypothetical protein